MQLCAELQLDTVRGGNRHTHHVPIQSVCMCTDVVCVGWGVWLLMWSVWVGVWLLMWSVLGGGVAMLIQQSLQM